MFTIKKICTVLALVAVGFTSCTKDFEQINTDPNNVPRALPQQLLTPALISTCLLYTSPSPRD